MANDSIPELDKFRQLNIFVHSAQLKDLGFFIKSGPYVEIRSDNVTSTRKTDFAKKTLNPIWEETFSILVKVNSLLEFRVCNLHLVKNVNIIGTAKVRSCFSELY